MKIINFKFSIFNKKNNIFLVLFLTLNFVLVPAVISQTRTSTASPTLEATTAIEDKDIQSLKDKIATKVAELREKNIKAVSGEVQEIISGKNSTTFKIKNWEEEIFEVKIDPELTKFFQIGSGVKKEAKMSAIAKNTYLVATGIIKEKSVEANFVYIDELYLVGSGKVTEVNKEDYFITLVTSDKQNYTLDIETFTKQQLLNIKTLVPENVGFSKIKEGDTAHFVVKKTGKEKQANRFSAQKILTIPQEYFVK